MNDQQSNDNRPATEEQLAAEQRRRRVLRAATAYALVSWVLLQLGEITFEPLQLPGWSLTALIIVLVLGFPVVAALAWIFERGPEGLKRARAGSLGATLSMLALVLMLDAGAGYYLYSIYAPGVMEDGRDSPAPAVAEQPAAKRMEANSIAVLPFVDMSPEGDQQYFSDGIAEEILTVLAAIDGLQVAARTSSFAFRGDERDVREIGRTLNVATVLEGSIRKSGDSVRVTAQLIDARNGFHLWTGNYDRQLKDIFAIQNEIATEIAEELLGSYEGFAMAARRGPAIASFEAYDLYLQGRDQWQKRTPESLNRAIELFNRTIELDPAYAPAYAGLADAYLLLANYGNLSMTEAIRQAEPSIRTALELDGQMSEGFASLGLLYWNLGRNTAAEGHLRRAVRLDPDNITARMWLGSLIGAQGRLNEEQLILAEALERDPLNPLINVNVAENDFQRGDYPTGMQRLERMLEIYPTSTLVLRTAAAWALNYGELGQAFAYMERALSIAPQEPTNQAMMTHLLLDVDEMEGARVQLEAAMEVGGNSSFVANTHARYLMMTDRLEALMDFARARLEQVGQAVVASKESVMPRFWLGRAHLLRGAPDEALEHFELITAELEYLPPEFAADALTWAAVAQLRSEHPDLATARLAEADRIVQELRLQGFREPWLSYLEACIASLRGDGATALSKLDETSRAGWVEPWEAEHDARLAPVRGQPGFVAWLDGLRERQQELRSRRALAGVAAL